MTRELRAAMTEAAVNAAKAIGYSSAGTTEFIIDAFRRSEARLLLIDGDEHAASV